MKKISVLLVLSFILIAGCAKKPSANSEAISVSSSKWEEKNIYTFGDSITWYDGNEYVSSHLDSGELAIGYQSYIRGELDAKVKNYGINGATLVQINETIKETDYSDADAVIIMGGINDWYKNTPLGEFKEPGEKFDETTTFGALQSAVEHILNEKEELSVYLISPIPAMIEKEGDLQEFPNTYDEMYTKIGDAYDFPVLSLYTKSKFSDDYNKWYRDNNEDPEVPYERYIHIGNEGYETISKYIIPFLVEN